MSQEPSVSAEAVSVEASSDSATATTTVAVRADRTYVVHIGRGVRYAISRADWAQGRRIAIIHSAGVGAIARDVRELLGQARVLTTIVVPDGESAKSIEAAEMCWDELANAGVSRGDLILAVGGGTVTDLAGFIAATWMRGIDVVHIPTTTAAMVDAAIGGKTGINTAAGKNLVGVFHSPVAVYCDLDWLRSLPVEEHVAGLMEALKCGFIADAELLRLFETAGSNLRRADHPALHEVVTRAIQVKADVVAGDFTESAAGIGRELLNYGHTFGHALEYLSDYQMRHGDAVAQGMVFAAELSHGLELAPRSFVEQHYELIGRLGVSPRHGVVQRDEAIAAMGRDKKARGGVLRFILLRGQADAVAVDGPAHEELVFAMMRSLNS